MDSRKSVLKDTFAVAVGEILLSAAMVGIFAAFGKFSANVVFSALAGSAVITLNYFFMAVTVSLAADRAEAGDAAKAKNMIQLSSAVRLVSMGLILFAGIRLGANVVALVLPLVFLRPILMLSEFFGKKVD